jgi:Domain of unknown function (DUF4261)
MTNPSALILLDEAAKLDMSQISEFLVARHPGTPIAMPNPEKGGSTTAVFNFAGSVVAVMQFDARLPDGFRAAARRAAMYWPEAEAVFARHRGHISVNVMGKSHDRLQVARVLTASTAAIVASHSFCSGVLWDLMVVNSRPEFAELGLQAFALYPNFPSALWVSMHPFRDPGSSRVGAVTNGLRNFIGREVELEGQSFQLKSLLTTARGLVTYLLQPGVAVRDGDTIGHSMGERIEVRLVDSQRFQGLPVLAARLPAA